MLPYFGCTTLLNVNYKIWRKVLRKKYTLEKEKTDMVVAHFCSSRLEQNFQKAGFELIFEFETAKVDLTDKIGYCILIY